MGFVYKTIGRAARGFVNKKRVRRASFFGPSLGSSREAAPELLSHAIDATHAMHDIVAAMW